MPVAITWTSAVALLDLVIVAGAVQRDWGMFRSVTGTWLPFALIFVATWATGTIMSMMPEAYRRAYGARRNVMTDKTWWESVKLEGEALVDKLKELIHEGNVRRIRIVHQGRTVAEFPLTAGVVAAVLAPVAAAIGAVVALLKDCSIEVERERKDDTG